MREIEREGSREELEILYSIRLIKIKYLSSESKRKDICRRTKQLVKNSDDVFVCCVESIVFNSRRKRNPVFKMKTIKIWKYEFQILKLCLKT